MRKYVIGILATLAVVGLVVCITPPFPRTEADEGDTGQPPPCAFVVTDLHHDEHTLAQMEAFGWTVKTISTLELELLAAKEGGLAGCDVVWVPVGHHYHALRLLVSEDGPLGAFARDGGVVVVMGLEPQDLWLDVAPGGVDSKPLPPEGAGVVEIADPSHPIISGNGTGGRPLDPTDLDPSAAGGAGNVFNPPADADAAVIATNTAGPVLIEHRHGKGRVFVSSLHHQTDLCDANVLLYIGTLPR
ncbi:MAG: hypothetical protein HY721_14000 [Planctomycetes bacterium]|nr:hypothetical protein [Planctomycetota bacterium]